MKGKKVVHRSPEYVDKDEWRTPKDLFDRYNERYGPFDLDAAATFSNTLAPKYFTKKDNALVQDWFGKVWCNPPYGLWQQFVAKAAFEVKAKRVKHVVLLLPARTDTKAFHTHIWKEYSPDTACTYFAVKLHFIKGRLKFSESKTGAPFPSMIVIFT